MNPRLPFVLFLLTGGTPSHGSTGAQRPGPREANAAGAFRPTGPLVEADAKHVQPMMTQANALFQQTFASLDRASAKDPRWLMKTQDVVSWALHPPTLEPAQRPEPSLDDLPPDGSPESFARRSDIHRLTSGSTTRLAYEQTRSFRKEGISRLRHRTLLTYEDDKLVLVYEDYGYDERAMGARTFLTHIRWDGDTPDEMTTWEDARIWHIHRASSQWRTYTRSSSHRYQAAPSTP